MGQAQHSRWSYCRSAVRYVILLGKSLKEEKMKTKIRKEMLPFIFILLGSFIAVIAAFYDYKNKLEEKEESLRTEKKRNLEYENIIGKNNEVILGQRAVIDNSTKIIELQNQLAEKNNQIHELQDVTLKTISGGNGIPKLRISLSGVSIHINIINENKFPVRNVSIQLEKVVFDYYVENGPESRIAIDDRAAKDITFKVGDLQIDSKEELHSERFEKEYFDYMYIYRVTWQNGNYTGGFKYKNKDGKVEITDSNVTIYSSGLNLEEAVRVNGEYSKVIPYHPKSK